MKKLLLSVVAIFALTTVTNAQNIGAVLGGNIANVSVDNLTTDSKFNFTIGLFAEFMLSDKLGIQPELIFSGQGFKFDEEDIIGSGLFIELKQKLTYVNVPVLVNYYVVENFYLQAGPYLGFLTNAEQNVSGSLGILGGDNKDSFESTDFGVSIGAGFKVEKFNLGFKYQLGMSEIQSASNMKNRVLNISLGYRFVEQ